MNYLYRTLFLLCCFSWNIGLAQQADFNWKIGVHGGLAQYYGDLNKQVFSNNSKLQDIFKNLDHISYGASLEKRLGNAWAVKLLGGYRQIVANDRALNFDGSLQSGADNFSRALNVKANIWETSLGIVYYTDYGGFFGPKAWLSPYFSIGGGLTGFKSYGDLWLGASGVQSYHYWSDQSIRDIAENAANAANAVIIEQDGKFETELQRLKTEGISYQPISWQAYFGVRLKFRLGPRVNLQLETSLHYTGTDYLDDLSGNYPDTYNSAAQAYASNPSNQSGMQRGGDEKWNDMYSVSTLSLHVSFGWVKSGFRAPIIFTDKEGSLASLFIEKDSLNELTEIDKDSTDSTEPIVENHSAKDTVKRIIDSVVVVKTKVEQDSLVTMLPDSFSKYNSLQMQIMQSELAKLRQELSETRVMTQLERMQLKSDYESALLKTMLDYQQQLDEWRWQWLRNTMGDSLQQRPYQQTPTPKYDKIDTSATGYKTISPKVQPAVRDTIVIVQKQIPAVDSKDKEALLNMSAQLESLEKKLAMAQQNSDSLSDKLYRDSLRTLLDNMTYKVAPMTNDTANASKASASDSLANITIKKLNNKIDSMRNALAASNVVTNKETVIYRNDNSGLREELAALRAALANVDTLKRMQADTVRVQIPIDNRPTIDYGPQIEGLSFEIAQLRQELLRQKSTNALTNNAARISPVTAERIQELEQENIRLKENLANLKQSMSLMSDYSEAMGKNKKDTIVMNKLRNKFHATHIYFGNSNTELTLQAKETLNTLLDQVAAYPELTLTIKGYASKSGVSATNMQLSKIRAEAVQRYILTTGKINASRLKVKYFGDTQSQGNELIDRRVEIDLSIQEK